MSLSIYHCFINFSSFLSTEHPFVFNYHVFFLLRVFLKNDLKKQPSNNQMQFFQIEFSPVYMFLHERKFLSYFMFYFYVIFFCISYLMLEFLFIFLF